MKRSEILERIQQNVCNLSDSPATNYPYIPLHQKVSPSITDIRKIMKLIKCIVFPGFFGVEQESQHGSLQFYLGVYMVELYDLLQKQVFHCLCFEAEACQIMEERASEIAMTFVDELPKLKHFLCTDVKAISNGDPAAHSISEIIFCYPSVIAILHQRVAHVLFKMDVPVLPRIITELAHAETGIDIHPGASIGEYFSIDHGTGVVIGQTAILGNHVSLYQGVTLGAKSFTLDDDGLPIDIPRHPILEDNVTIYSNASILGRITIGEGSVIGGNIWLTHSVPPHSKVLQTSAVEGKGGHIVR